MSRSRESKVRFLRHIMKFSCAILSVEVWKTDHLGAREQSMFLHVPMTSLTFSSDIRIVLPDERLVPTLMKHRQFMMHMKRMQADSPKRHSPACDFEGLPSFAR